MNLTRTGEGVQTSLTNGDSPSKAMLLDIKLKKALAKRIFKAGKNLLQDAMAKESELRRKPVEQELKNLDNLLKTSSSSRRESVDDFALNGNGHNLEQSIEVERDHDLDVQMNGLTNGEIDPAISKLSQHLPNGVNGHDDLMTDAVHVSPDSAGLGQPPTPPLSAAGEAYSLSHGGAPWYMEAFSPIGTTVSEEQWTGVRGMSETLSDMDEDELSGLVDANGMKDGMNSGKKLKASPLITTTPAAKKRKTVFSSRKRRR